MRRYLVAVVSAGLMSTAVLMPQAATAKPVVMEHYSVTDAFSYSDCGFPVDVEVEGSGLLTIRTVKGSDQAFLGFDNYEFREVHTNAATGEWFVIRGNGLFRDTSATLIEGNIYEFTIKESGQPFVVEDSSGNVVMRDRGLLQFRAVFDTLGDGEPGGDLLEFELVSIHGPHPGQDADFCELATDLIG